MWIPSWEILWESWKKSGLILLSAAALSKRDIINSFRFCVKDVVRLGRRRTPKISWLLSHPTFMCGWRHRGANFGVRRQTLRIVLCKEATQQHWFWRQDADAISFICRQKSGFESSSFKPFELAAKLIKWSEFRDRFRSEEIEKRSEKSVPGGPSNWRLNEWCLTFHKELR